MNTEKYTYMYTPESTAIERNRQLIAERLKEERLRLGFSQTELAGLIGTTRGTVIKYETCKSMPGAESLAEMHSLGFDTGYILSGLRTGPLAVDRKKFLQAFLEVSRQAVASKNPESLAEQVGKTWAIYDAYKRFGKPVKEIARDRVL